MLYAIIPLLSLALIIAALANVITTNVTRHLDKMTWILIIIFVPLVGSILWFAVGRVYNLQAPASQGSIGDPRRHQEWASSASTEQQLAALEREIEASEKAERIANLEAELKAKREARGQ